jgi:hypothetical protein
MYPTGRTQWGGKSHCEKARSAAEHQGDHENTGEEQAERDTESFLLERELDHEHADDGRQRAGKLNDEGPSRCVADCGDHGGTLYKFAPDCRSALWSFEGSKMRRLGSQ